PRRGLVRPMLAELRMWFSRCFFFSSTQPKRGLPILKTSCILGIWLSDPFRTDRVLRVFGDPSPGGQPWRAGFDSSFFGGAPFLNSGDLAPMASELHVGAATTPFNRAAILG